MKKYFLVIVMFMTGFVSANNEAEALLGSFEDFVNNIEKTADTNDSVEIIVRVTKKEGTDKTVWLKLVQQLAECGKLQEADRNDFLSAAVELLEIMKELNSYSMSSRTTVADAVDIDAL